MHEFIALFIMNLCFEVLYKISRIFSTIARPLLQKGGGYSWIEFKRAIY